MEQSTEPRSGSRRTTHEASDTCTSSLHTLGTVGRAFSQLLIPLIADASKHQLLAQYMPMSALAVSFFTYCLWFACSHTVCGLLVHNTCVAHCFFSLRHMATSSVRSSSAYDTSINNRSSSVSCTTTISSSVSCAGAWQHECIPVYSLRVPCHDMCFVLTVHKSINHLVSLAGLFNNAQQQFS